MEKITLAEARLRQLSKERGFYDSANRAARAQLRDASQEWLLANPPLVKVTPAHFQRLRRHDGRPLQCFTGSSYCR